MPDSLRDYKEFIEELKGAKNQSLERLTALGLAYRITHELEKSEECLKESLELAFKANNENSIFAAKIRLAHCYQWMKQFRLSNTLFIELEKRLSFMPQSLQASFWQHKGKNEFDQMHYQEALNYFEKALNIRTQCGLSKDVIESSQIAISETKKRLKVFNDDLTTGDLV